MGSNQHRSSAGKTLIAFAALVVVVTGFSVYLRVNRVGVEFTSYPTGLGDQDFYLSDLGPGFDLFLPNLVFEGQPEELSPGLYRRNHDTVNLKDRNARQLVREKGGRYWVYVAESKDGKRVRYFLKVADDAYIEFGKQKYFPEPGDTRPGVRPNPPSKPENSP